MLRHPVTCDGVTRKLQREPLTLQRQLSALQQALYVYESNLVFVCPVGHTNIIRNVEQAAMLCPRRGYTKVCVSCLG